jgi:hypothetical protein
LLRPVAPGGLISFLGRKYGIGKAFAGEHVALRAVSDGVWDVYYYMQRITKIDLTSARPDL